MSKTTVSKLQIAQAKECAHRCERYALGLDMIIKMCKGVLPLSQYTQLPDDFKLAQKKDMGVIIRDLESMLHDVKTLKNAKTDKADNLQKQREEGLKMPENNMKLQHNSKPVESGEFNFHPMPKRFMVWDRQNKVFLTQAMEIWQIVNHFQGRVGDLVNDDLSDRRYVFCQSTNLFNKDGKEIFEGSIVRSHEGVNFVVYYNPSAARFMLLYLPTNDGANDLDDDVVIIGHILSNPELVEEQ